MVDAGNSVAMLPVEEAVKKAIHLAVKHLHDKYGMSVKEVGKYYFISCREGLFLHLKVTVLAVFLFSQNSL